MCATAPVTRPSHAARLAFAFLLGLLAAPLYPATPEFLVTDRFDEWAIGADVVNWAYRCGDTVDCGSVYLKRQPVHGGLVQTTTGSNGALRQRYYGLAADDDGVVYFDDEVNRILLHRADERGKPPANLLNTSARPLSPIETDDEAVYWGASNGVYRALKEPLVGSRIVATSAVVDVAIDETGLYFANGEAIYRLPYCPSWPKCTAELLRYASVSSIARIDGSTYFVAPYLGRDAIQRILFNGGVSIEYRAASSLISIGRLASDGTHLFWIESTSLEDVLKRKRLNSGVGGQVDDLDFRRPGLILASDPSIEVDEHYVYYRLKRGHLRRIPLDAPPLARDLAASEWLEVTQSLQSFDLDVPLVARKTTWVRGWGHVLDGPSAGGVDAVLHVEHDGIPVAGSPIRPFNEAQYLWTVGGVPRRDLDNGYWLFRLPGELLEPGDVTLRLEVDPGERYEDSAPANDSFEVPRRFISRPPACVAFIPVRTHAPRVSLSDPNVAEMFDRFRTLWPTHELRVSRSSSPVEELQACWWGIVPYPCYGPYELPDDGWKVLTSLVVRDTFTDDPDDCDDAGARTHYVGTVHPDTSTGTSKGLGNLCLAASWVKFASHDTPAPGDRDWSWPPAGFTLAHEMAHNYSREHVACGDPDDPDPSYPYAECAMSFLDGQQTRTHFGFDPRDREPIAPTEAGDLMSYAPKRWTSDWTFKHLFAAADSFSVASCLWDMVCGQQPGYTLSCPWLKRDDAGHDPTSRESTVPFTLPWADEIRRASKVVLVTGSIGPDESSGELSSVWLYPTAAASSGMLRKWTERAAPETRALPGGASGYLLRLVDARGRTIDERALAPREVTLPDSPEYRAVFTATFPAPAGTVGAMELFAAGERVDRRDFGPATPTVQIRAPRPSSVHDSELTIEWTAQDTDGDPLFVTVQYSADAGASWQALVSDWPMHPSSDRGSLTFGLADSGIPGSDPSSRVQVLVSDGYHTGVAVSGSFTVADQPPWLFIAEPGPEQRVEPGIPVLLRGSGHDSEDGTLPPLALAWRLNGTPVGNGEEIAVPGLAPGAYEAELRGMDSGAQTATEVRPFEVGPLVVPYIGTAPELDGLCDEVVWAGAVSVPLREYTDGNRGTVRLLRTPGHLWACMSGMNRGGGSPVAFAGLRIDVDHSRHALAQPSDFGFFVDEGGQGFTRAGNGSGGFSADGPGGLAARISAGSRTWQAELRIDGSVIGGFDHVIGLDAAHYWVRYQGDDYHWPAAAGWNQPFTWATTSLGVLPRLAAVTPSSASVGQREQVVRVTGSGFLPGAVVERDGRARPTRRLGSTELEATFGRSDLDEPGMALVTVSNGTPGDAPSNAAPFLVRYPKPEISRLDPADVPAGSDDIELAVIGSGFASGAVVLFDGVPQDTPTVGTSRLEARIPSELLVDARVVTITVENPEPAEGTSNPATFVIAIEPVRTEPVFSDGFEDAPLAPARMLEDGWRG